MSTCRPVINARETTRFIKDQVAKYNSFITVVVVPPSVERIGNESFFNCMFLHSKERLSLKKLEKELLCQQICITLNSHLLLK